MMNNSFKIYYEDNHIIVVFKEKGILSQPDSSNRPDMLTMIKDYIKVKYQKPGNVFLGLVHRLDINTSGIMVYAKTSKAAQRLSDSILKHEFSKCYHATVEGILNNIDFIKLENNIIKDENEKKSYISNEGKKSILYYSLIDPILKSDKHIIHLQLLSVDCFFAFIVELGIYFIISL